MSEGYSPINGEQLQRTDISCHVCNKMFIAELDFSINGDNIIECPNCGHEHYRTIKDGKITEARWDSSKIVTRVKGKSVWKSNVIKARTSSVSVFIRDCWINRSDFNGI